MKLDFKVAILSLNFLSFFLALPLIIQTFPYLGWIFFACIPGLFLLVYLFKNKEYKLEIFTNNLSLLIIMLVTVFFYGMLLDVKSVSNEVVRDSVRGAAFLLATFFLLYLKCIDELAVVKKILESTRIIILISGVIGAVFGLFKYLTTNLGYRINLFNNSFGEYPWGTSLVMDYNFYGLSLLIALFISLQLWRQSVDAKNSLFYSCIASILFSAGILSGSRPYF